jgi:hypothetical protein
MPPRLFVCRKNIGPVIPPTSVGHDPEARARLSHPGSRSICSIEETAGCDFIVMEYVDVEALSTLQARENLPLKEVLDRVPHDDANRLTPCGLCLHTIGLRLRELVRWRHN